MRHSLRRITAYTSSGCASPPVASATACRRAAFAVRPVAGSPRRRARSVPAPSRAGRRIRPASFAAGRHGYHETVLGSHRVPAQSRHLRRSAAAADSRSTTACGPRSGASVPPGSPRSRSATRSGRRRRSRRRRSRIGLGTGVVGIWSRSAVTMALQAATLNELSDGRLLLGVGLQARGYVEGWHGQRYERPVRAMREFVTILRRILSGENVTFEGEIFSVQRLPAHDAAARAAGADLHGGDRPADDPSRRRARGRDPRLLLLGRVRARHGAAQPARGSGARGALARRLRRRLRLPDDRHAGRRRGSSRSRAR